MVNPNEIPVGVSGKHLHLSQADLETLFGEGYKLTEMKPLSQPGQFASEEVVNVVGPKGTLKNVRVLGPIRKQTQIEVSRTDAFALGLKPPVKDSGDLAGSLGITLEGPKGSITLNEGVIIAMRHLHLSIPEAESLGLSDKQIVSLKTSGPRGLIFDNVLVRVHQNFALDFHVDTDEANAAFLNNGDKVQLVR
jgi:putative phosphotransacetylase